MGKKILFLIDTGASKSVIDQSFIETNFPNRKIKETTHQTTGLGANIPNSSFIRMQRVQLGDIKIGSVQFALLDLDVVNSAYSMAGLEKVEAIIGGDVLKKYKCVIDYNNEILILNSKL